MRRARCLWPAALLFLACGQWQRVGTDPRPRPAAVLPGLFDAPTVYRAMGFFATGAPLPFVASLRYLASPVPDSTLTILSLSLANQTLAFHREGNRFAAAYHVEFGLRTDTATLVQLGRDETVRVASFQETLRPDESVIFQQFLYLPPGTYAASVAVRDRNSSAFARHEMTIAVPRLKSPAVSTPVTYYEGTGRSALAELPRLLVNPRATVPYGVEPLHLYLEIYGAPAGARLAAGAADIYGVSFWTDTVTLGAGDSLEARVLEIPAPVLPVGRAEVVAGLVGTDTATWGRAQLFVSFSNQWAIANFDELLNLLRYFYPASWVDSLRAAAPADRPTVWRNFWRATDPNPVTPDNEALDEYLRKIQIANLRFAEQGGPGWLTDRGEVYVTLGEPDEMYDATNDYGGQLRLMRWTYLAYRLTLYFRDESAFGRYRLTPESRAEFMRVRERVRRSQ